MVGLREIMTKMQMLFLPQNQMMAMTRHDSLPERSYMKDHSGCLVTEGSMFSDTEKGKKYSKPSLRSNKSYLQSLHKVRSISATLTQFCSN